MVVGDDSMVVGDDSMVVVSVVMHVRFSSIPGIPGFL
jgi:hypothetical protein